ncbi:hypothetical protein NFI96_000101 [Prochilodus magdalenae]|nr:hypothetical protein NFI96_000101 [Prochilodus magdalenae]
MASFGISGDNQVSVRQSIQQSRVSRWNEIRALSSLILLSSDCTLARRMLTAFSAKVNTNKHKNNKKLKRTKGARDTAAVLGAILDLCSSYVRHTLSRVNVRSAAGPDGVPGRVLRACAHELSGVFAHIFNLLLAQAAVPTIFKTATIVPVPKHPTASVLNDFRPVALTPIISKCFERLVLSHLKSCLPATLDPHQFAYRGNRSTEDAISTALHTALTHLDCQNSYVRMLFIDFSAAFNTVIPSKLISKLNHLGLIRDNDETAYRDEVQHLSTWCHDNNLTLNTQKTKEIIMDLRRSRSQAHPPFYISGAAVEQVTSFKFLGTHISSDLTWSLNSSVLVKKAQQRLYFLRSLKKVHLSPRILVNFYCCTIESILTNGISVWITDTPRAPEAPKRRPKESWFRTRGRTGEQTMGEKTRERTRDGTGECTGEGTNGWTGERADDNWTEDWTKGN